MDLLMKVRCQPVPVVERETTVDDAIVREKFEAKALPFIFFKKRKNKKQNNNNKNELIKGCIILIII